MCEHLAECGSEDSMEECRHDCKLLSDRVISCLSRLSCDNDGSPCFFSP
ncbi:hypothetical protein AKJ08_2320 [Vulgatibacter incomptus]|uniref:Uncharacterized protein n=2 Tax=Vulgatibacter incomptus TaxID=1391653 RepID=A0A0K1PEH3_9BACT|nr:hypothetical protein AKJ08_2320 [Vulgatibacter incomptus]